MRFMPYSLELIVATSGGRERARPCSADARNAGAANPHSATAAVATAMLAFKSSLRPTSFFLNIVFSPFLGWWFPDWNTDYERAARIVSGAPGAFICLPVATRAATLNDRFPARRPNTMGLPWCADVTQTLNVHHGLQ